MPKAKTLKELLQRPVDRAPVITITGDPGVGKTTLASLFPRPCVLQFEDGLQAIPAAKRPYAFPVATSLAEGIEYLRALQNEDNRFETLIIDTVSKLGSIIEAEVIESSPNKTESINQAYGGYGGGQNRAAELHRLFAEECVALNAYNMTIIYVAHSSTETVNPPDGPEFHRYSLRLNQRSQRPYVDDVDLIAYIRLRTRYVTREKDDKAKAVADRARVIVCHPTGAHISKNRYGIEEPITWIDKTANPLLEYIPFFTNGRAHATEVAAPTAKAKSTTKGK